MPLTFQKFLGALVAPTLFLFAKPVFAAPVAEAKLKEFRISECQEKICALASGKEALFSKFGTLMAANDVEMSLLMDFQSKIQWNCQRFSYDLKSSWIKCESGEQTVTLNLSEMSMRRYPSK